MNRLLSEPSTYYGGGYAYKLAQLNIADDMHIRERWYGYLFHCIGEVRHYNNNCYTLQTKLVWVSQCGAATLFRWDGRVYNFLMLNFLKIDSFFAELFKIKRYRTNIRGRFFETVYMERFASRPDRLWVRGNILAHNTNYLPLSNFALKWTFIVWPPYLEKQTLLLSVKC